MVKDKPSIEDVLMHYGIDHIRGNPGSGRYRWGSGKHSYQHSGTFLSRMKELEKSGLIFVDEDGKFGPKGKTYTGETAVAHYIGLSSTDYRLQKTLAKNEERLGQYNRARALLESGYGYSEIARKMGLKNESSVRSLLKEDSYERMQKAKETADFLKEKLNERLKDDPKAMIDIGRYVENDLGISRKKLDDAIFILEREGYITDGGRLKNVTDMTGAHQTTLNVIGPPGMKKGSVYDYEHIYSIEDYISRDNGLTYEKKFHYPESMSSDRLIIRYAEDGGKDKDGVIELRRNVDDLDLKGSNYAQVRILVDENRFLKGMAIYGDDKDFPKGVDVIFNTNKHKDVSKLDVLKPISEDPDNPFSSSIKEKGGQYWYTDKNGEQKLGLINKRADEGDWSEWKDKVPAQFLSKQPYKIAERQLNLAIEDKKQELKEILALENNTVKKYYLDAFATDCDSAAVHLQAAAFPRQKYHVILPSNKLKDTEVYAPNYNNGETVALIRYPHAGPFEIPILKVNNKISEPQKMVSLNNKDAIVINSKVAERLSGADFDGDTVMVIPFSDKVSIKSSPRLRQLEGFEPKDQYATTRKIDSDGNERYYNSKGVEVKIMKNTQTEMGKISNLINDMTIAGATDDEKAKAVKHSMVVIDAEKHKLDYKSSEVENDIKLLKRKYQGRYENETYKDGAATLISRSKSEMSVTKRQGQPKVNIKGTDDYDPNRPEGALLYKESKNKTYYVSKHPETGKEINVYQTKKGTWKYLDYDEKGNVITDSKGKKKYFTLPKDSKVKEKTRTQASTQMMETDDARTLISKYDTKIEHLYANYANTMKGLANEARKINYYTKDIKYDPSAKKTYQKEVDELDSALIKSQKNAPRERQAQILASSRVKAKKQSNPNMKKDDEKKIRQQELTKARGEVGARRSQIEITDKQWEAIQAGAVNATKLKKILSNTDMDKVKERATPRSYREVSDAKIAKIKAMKNSNYTNAEIAKALGISASTVSKYVNNG